MAIPCGFKVQNLSALYYIICVGINIISHYNSFILSVKASHLVRRLKKTQKTPKKKKNETKGWCFGLAVTHESCLRAEALQYSLCFHAEMRQ